MADGDASPPSTSPHARRVDKRPERTPTPRSSLTASQTDHVDHVLPKPRFPHSKHVHDEGKRHVPVGHRPHKQRSSGAFLLPDALPAESSAAERLHSHRRHRPVSDGHITESRPGTPENIQSNGHSDGSQTITSKSASKRSSRTSETIGGVATSRRDSVTDAATLDGSKQSSAAPLDMDSAQIVNMALSLSESRRQAARRNISSPLPPRLAPLPDGSPGGSLWQHLQQQRRVSRNISPRPGAPARSASGQNVATPLKPGFDQEGSYRYHFSPSTLARAQKAKDYLELQAQYRRVLDLVAPLTPDQARRPSSNASVYGSPTSSQILSRPTTRSFDSEKRGRPYNPLQYIRNRKVRTRERKTIDGEAQGFTDVPRVSQWVDEATKSVADGQITDSGSSLPPFNTPEEMANGGSTSRPAVTASKSKRPRVDWVIDPADMLADVYWLEQGTNKNMVEDRDGRRVFVQDSSLYRPMSQQMGARKNLSAPSPGSHDATGRRAETEPPPGLGQETSKGESEHVFGSARGRAQQKLQAIKGLHHRHNNPANHRYHDFLRSRSGSLSGSSDNESDRKGRSRGDTVGSSGKGILEKQMLEMIEREHGEKELEARQEQEAGHRRSLTAETVQPESDSVVHSAAPSRTPSRRRGQQSVAEANGDAKAHKSNPLLVSPERSTRASLEVPSTGRRLSIDYDTSYPASPEFKPAKGVGLVPALGKDLPPRSSRPSSPSRNPLSKVKSMFRDRSRERAQYSDERRGSVEANVLATGATPDTSVDTVKQRPTEREGSISPIHNEISRGSDTSNTSPRNHGSLRHRPDDSYGIRGLLKGPRIDSVLRSGVSRVSDLIWRKDMHDADGDSSSSSDELDTGPDRGRTRELAAEPGKKTFLDVMPSFVPASQSHSRPPHVDQGPPHGADLSSQPLSRQSSRFELLKPPKIDVRDTSDNVSPAVQQVRSHRGSDTSVADSRKSSNAEAVRAANSNLNAAISMPQGRRLSTATSQSQRHWCISDGNGRPAAPHAVVSKAEIARLRALVLSSGIMAKEIIRRAEERRSPDGLLFPGPCATRRPSATPSGSPSSSPPPPTALAPVTPPTWASIASLHPDPRVREALLSQPLSQTDVFPAAARALAAAIEKAGTEWQSASQTFSAATAPDLHRKVESARQTVAGRLSDMTRSAADEADEVGLDLSQGQRLKVKRVVDVIEKMLRRRRRRFRWVRRGLWLGVEWMLVGFMWCVWFVVVIARMVLGCGRGVRGAVRWVLWL